MTKISTDKNQDSCHWRRRLACAFSLRTMLGRLLLSTSLLVMITLVIAYYSQHKFSTSTDASTNRLSERISINHRIVGLRNNLWAVETRFQSYMLVPEVELKSQVLGLMDSTLESFKQFSSLHAFEEYPAAEIINAELGNKLLALKRNLDEVMEIRADPLKVYPTMPIMVNELDPTNRALSNQIALALSEVQEMEGDAGQKQVQALLNELRFTWLQKINTFRLLISTRVGIFQGSVLNSIRATSANIELYNAQITKVLKQLRALDDEGMLGLQQSTSLAEIEVLNESWNMHYQRAKEIISQDDGWRRDTPLMRDTITPLFLSVWSDLEMLDGLLQRRAEEDLALTKNINRDVSYSLWLLALVVLAVSVTSTLLFEWQLRRPIIRISRALNEEAMGKQETPLPESPITETKQLIQAFAHMRQQVHSRQEHLQAVLTYAADAIVTTLKSGEITSFNPAAEKLFGYASSAATSQLLQHFIEDYDLLRELPTGNERESMAINSQGEEFPVGLRVSNMTVGDEELLLVMIADIRERRLMLDGIQAREQRLRSILDNTAEAIVTFDEYGHIESWNYAAEQLFGWEQNEVIGSVLTQFISSDTLNSGSLRMRRDTIEPLMGHESEVIGQHINGTSFPLSLKVGLMYLDGKTKYTALLANISERKAMMEHLRHLAEHDSLTGLYNRAYFHDRLEQAVDAARNQQQELALLYIDLDNFKYVNDTLGHLAGDRLLIEVSGLLNMRARRSDLVVRLGGDEFVLLIDGVNPNNASAISESYRKLLADYNFNYEGKSVDVGCSIGVALMSETSPSAGEVLSQADVACHLAKRGGRNRVHIFSARDEGDVNAMSLDMGWSRRIRQALEHDRFVLAAQPIYTTDKREIESYEILVRMLDEDGSIIMPSGFLPTAERFGLSVEVDLWIIRHAITELARLHQHGHALRFALNLSGQSMTVPIIAQTIPELLQQTGLNASALTFEVTETAAISEMDKAVKLLNQLQQLGCLTALDDFGSGMSSFAYLQELPVDIVKIDGRFVQHIAESSVDQAVVKAMNDIAHALGKKTVAEFVENEQHFAKLQAIGVDYSQGYHLGKPRLLNDIIAEFIKQPRRSSGAA